MKKLFVFSDVHSFYDELRTALDEAGFEDENNDHILVSLGDLCDRGEQSREVLDFINGIPEERKICLIGNHETLMDDYIARGYAQWYDITNGTVKTAADLCEEGQSVRDLQGNERWQTYKRSWRLYFETDKYVFVHGWIPFRHKPFSNLDMSYDPDWRQASVQEFQEAAWQNGMLAWSQGIREPGKTIFCGHVHVSWGHHYLHDSGAEYFDPGHPEDFPIYAPFTDEGIIALDACTVLSRSVNVWLLELEDEEYDASRKNDR